MPWNRTNVNRGNRRRPAGWRHALIFCRETDIKGAMQTPQILSVEDSPETQQAIRDHFTKLGCDVTVAGSAEDALKKLQQGFKANVIILDFRLPGMSGPEFYRQIGALPALHKIPIVPFTSLLTSHWQSDIASEWLAMAQAEGKSDQALPIVSKPGTEDVKAISPELILSVAYAIRQQGLELPPLYKETFGKLVRLIYGKENPGA